MCLTAGLFTVYFFSSFSCRAWVDCVLLRDCLLCIDTPLSLVELGEFVSCCGIVYCVFLLLFFLKSLGNLCLTAGLFTVYFYNSFFCRTWEIVSCCGIVYCVFLQLFLLKSLGRMCLTAGLFTVYFYYSFSCRAWGECVLLRDCLLCISTRLSLEEPG